MSWTAHDGLERAKKRPRGYPADLRFPEDVMKAVPNSKTLKPLKAKRPAVNRVAKAHRLYKTCNDPADHIDDLCDCKDVPWDEQLTEQ